MYCTYPSLHMQYRQTMIVPDVQRTDMRRIDDSSSVRLHCPHGLVQVALLSYRVTPMPFFLFLFLAEPPAPGLVEIWRTSRLFVLWRRQKIDHDPTCSRQSVTQAWEGATRRPEEVREEQVPCKQMRKAWSRSRNGHVSGRLSWTSAAGVNLVTRPGWALPFFSTLPLFLFLCPFMCVRFARSPSTGLVGGAHDMTPCMWSTVVRQSTAYSMSTICGKLRCQFAVDAQFLISCQGNRREGAMCCLLLSSPSTDHEERLSCSFPAASMKLRSFFSLSCYRHGKASPRNDAVLAGGAKSLFFV